MLAITLVGMLMTFIIKIIVLFIVKRFGEGLTIKNVLLKNGQLAVSGYDSRGQLAFEIFIGEAREEIEMNSEQFVNEMEEYNESDFEGDESDRANTMLFDS